MRTCMACLSIATLALIVVPGCARGEQPGMKEVRLDEEFVLSVGQSAVVEGEDLQITFTEVLSDSRCPEGATCIWAGAVSSALQVVDSGSTYVMVLTQLGLASFPTDSLGDYEVTFDVQPYPELGTELQAEDYRLHLTITAM